LRLLTDHGVFFEFIAPQDLGHHRPTRHSLAEVVPGVPYAVAISSAAGVWACLSGQTIAFESRDPPFLHLLGGEAPRLPVTPARPSVAGAAHLFPVQPPHARREAPMGHG
jgi:hypothetical protein